MELVELLLSQTPRETAGSRTDKRYNYQKDYSLYLLLKLHKEGSDYVFLFDFHDDLVVLDKEKSPNKVSFYQIKTKHPGHWLLTNLLQRKENLLSPLGKLYYNKVLFEEFTESLHFVSNAQFKLKMDDDSETYALKEFDAKRLKTSDISKINKQLQDEHSLAAECEFESITFFKVSDLSLNDSQTHCEGAIGAIMNELVPGIKINSGLVYQQLFREIKRKSAYEVLETPPTTLDELIDKKGLSRTKFEEILKVVGAYKDLDEVWKEIEARFTMEGLPLLKTKAYKKSWRDLDIKLLSKGNNTVILELFNDVRTFTRSKLAEDSLQSLSLAELLNEILTKLKAQVNTSPFEDIFVKCIILRELYHE